MKAHFRSSLSSIARRIAPVVALLPLASCSGSSGGDAPGGSGASALGGSSGTGGSSGSAGSAGEPDAGGSGSPACTATTALEPGRNYGDYSLFAIRIDAALAPGAYVPHGDGGGAVRVLDADGALVAEVSYPPQASLADGAQQTVAFAGVFELDVRSQTQPTLAGLDDAMFDGCHHVVAAAATSINAAQTYGAILVEAVTIDPSAPSGTYTFFAASGNAGQVELRRDGSAVTTLDYAWMTSIGGGDSFVFEFPGLLSLGVTRAMGTSNLFGVAATLFDGRHQIVVP
jgi:hypothetical protein